jgi:hypothetical protein
MSQPIESPHPTGESPHVDAGEPLQFDQAEFETPAAERPTCMVCKQPIRDEYYEIHGKVMCPRCRHGVEAAFRGGSPAARVLLATLFGVVGAAAGAVIYYVSIRATGWNLSLVSIFVGFIVGKAVRQGTGNRGGPFYQLLAMFLTYTSLVAMNVLMEIPEVSLRAWIESMVELFPAPLQEAMHDPIAAIIYAFALWEAWKLNSRAQLVFNGPFRLGAAGSADGKPEGVDDGV